MRQIPVGTMRIIDEMRADASTRFRVDLKPACQVRAEAAARLRTLSYRSQPLEVGEGLRARLQR